MLWLTKFYRAGVPLALAICEEKLKKAIEENVGIDYDVTKLYYEQLPSLTLQDITNFEKQNIVGKPFSKNYPRTSVNRVSPGNL